MFKWSMRIYFSIIILIFSCKNQQPDQDVHGRLEVTHIDQVQTELFTLLKQRDSLMFELSYNQLNTSILEELATDDIEFYHDQGGATYNKADFIDGMKGLGNLSYRARRELIEGSTEVFPMYKNGTLYAAILKGEHRFFAKEPNDKPEYITSTAKYTTLWILEDEQWKMSRVFSYDHRSPGD